MQNPQDKYKSIRNNQRMQSRLFSQSELQERLHLLEQLKKLLHDNEAAWLAALKEDLHKPPVEAYASELAVLLNEIDVMQKQLKHWLKPKRQRRFLFTGVERVEISRQPYGSVLILSPWNYPLQLALMPVIGALAAGNGVVLKPSEFAPETSRLLSELVPLYFNEKVLAVVEGEAEVAKQLTELAWDFIFFTGSQETGQKVYEAAAKHLTPTLLELGGKNPCIVDESGLNDETIKQIVWGKFLNAGQSCIAPDTVYVERKIYEEFLERFTQKMTSFYSKHPELSADYGRIIHEEQFDQVVDFLKDGRVYAGGEYEKKDLYIEPTVLVDIEPGSAAVTEEIFGPILPIVPYDSVEELLRQLERLPVPLVTYVFSQNNQMVHQVNQQLESGALSRNQVILHSTSPNLPFGGKGKSGIGRYHGAASFEAFTYEKSVYSKQSFFKVESQYPPYPKKALQALRKFRKYIF
jgi:aldehyde dehydrogenase (NAD+)